MQSLLLLHGAIGSMEQLFPLKEALSKQFEVYVFNFPGHGSNVSFEPFSIEAFAKATSDFIEKNQLYNPLVFGYSMGGYVAVYLEATCPGTFRSIVTLGTKYEWNEEVAKKETKMLQPDLIEQKVPAFAQQLASRHGVMEWKNVLHKTAAMLLDLGKHPLLPIASLQNITCPILILLGEKDNMVSIEETQNTATALINGYHELLPNSMHPIEQVDVRSLAEKINVFFLNH
ncbi:MAG: alpha/beta hydrolase [Chitinophagaceae bacterium]|nr:alpha/beta hydrolase [Chitinophagaceae bacterium]